MTATTTQGTEAEALAFLETVEPERRREEGRALDALFRETTGWSPRLWGDSLVGYGRYRYRYESGREGEFLATGFSPRKAHLVLYIMPGYSDLGGLLSRLGPHKLGKSCLYIRRLETVDAGVVSEIVPAGLADLASRWEVHPD
ncbi:DUF1801 domain-containing protein [Histidinibacterium aquaticum]|uniref:DUF1801 domain-containing protein n=1 Tax=Histidinibacterium aquaticum TaxID=2613962 RepID=A0A5J5GKS0_9RHOB|nr:DUF1801 domain-containing protein [Histidinibacterium aquaticum]KAA9008253.1 DUF1801 domain-containing protein [Histidinibacterium aquaticum]